MDLWLPWKPTKMSFTFWSWAKQNIFPATFLLSFSKTKKGNKKVLKLTKPRGRNAPRNHFLVSCLVLMLSNNAYSKVLPFCQKSWVAQSECHNPSTVIGRVRVHWPDNLLQLASHSNCLVLLLAHNCQIPSAFIWRGRERERDRKKERERERERAWKHIFVQRWA